MTASPNTQHITLSTYDTVIIGAGAAGLMCAATSGNRGRKVLLLDHAKLVGEKIRISGGGRCNFTNLHASPANFLSQNPRFCVSALKRYTQHDFIALVEKYGIAYHEKTLGQLFCDGSSKQIIDILITECKNAGVQIKLETSVTNIEKTDTGFSLETSGGKINCSSVVIATGGPSIPKMGATGWGYEIAKKFGMKVISPRAGLVPFTLDERALNLNLAGVALNVVATCNKKQFTEAMLFTHKGLSGPAILQISSYWMDGDLVEINLAPQHDVATILKDKKSSQPKQGLQTALAEILPKRLAQVISEEFNLQGNLADLSNKNIEAISTRINKWKIIPNGTEGFRTAEVTLGGVDTDGLSSQSMESKTTPGLFFIGEVVDVTGHLGGFNFQWAWSSGFAAGQYA